MLIFVYGTLKVGFVNNYLLSKSLFKGEGTTVNKFGMFLSSCGAYPFVIESQENIKIPGQLFEITKETEKQLDILEGYPSYYTKKKIDVKTLDNKIVQATMYIKNENNFKDSIDLSKPLTNW